MKQPLKIKEAMQFLRKLGCRISETTVRKDAGKWERSGKDGLQCYRLGGIPRYGALGFDAEALRTYAKKKTGWSKAQ